MRDNDECVSAFGAFPLARLVDFFLFQLPMCVNFKFRLIFEFEKREGKA
jgi:hypothetical protein